MTQAKVKYIKNKNRSVDTLHRTQKLCHFLSPAFLSVSCFLLCILCMCVSLSICLCLSLGPVICVLRLLLSICLFLCHSLCLSVFSVACLCLSMTSPVSWNSTSPHAEVDLVHNMKSLPCFLFSSSIVN